VEPLDNMMWHAMSGPQRELSQGDERARRYPADIGPFAALPDEPTAESHEALRDLVGPGNVAVLLGGDVTPPQGWELRAEINAVQMMGPDSSTTRFDDPRIIPLGAGDVEEMLSLTSRTKPGPFAPRTWELGEYLGIRVDGRLVSMAGQRARTSEYVEISAVCTDEEYVGRGMGRALVTAQVEFILAAGKLPMLHASKDNLRAIALYEYLGFRLRRRISGVVMRAPL
jgi:ribosomal protein S18 acetylase RimI-like enzyme